ncbi:DUF4397 domain-containing protein [Flavitalea flava]
MRKNKWTAAIYWTIILGILGLGFTGCAKSSSTSTNTVATFVTAMNLAPYAPSTEIYLNGSKSTVAIPSGSYLNGYSRLNPAIYDIQFKVAGSDSLLAQIPASIYDSVKFYTLLLYNTTVNGTAKAAKIADDFSNITTASGFYRFFNMCPDAPLVDFYLNTTVSDPNRAVADNVSRTSLNLFKPVNPASYTLKVKVAGTDSVLATMTDFNPAAANAYTIFFTGKPNNTTNPLSIKVFRAVY